MENKFVDHMDEVDRSRKISLITPARVDNTRQSVRFSLFSLQHLLLSEVSLWIYSSIYNLGIEPSTHPSIHPLTNPCFLSRFPPN